MGVLKTYNLLGRKAWNITMLVKSRKTVKSKKKWNINVIKKDFKRNHTIYMMLIPVVLFYVIFSYMPMYGAIIAFKNYRPNLGVIGSDWVGLKHFITFFTSPSFWSLLRNTLTISISSIIFSFPAPIILALLLNELQNKRFAKIVQNFTYMPHFISLVVVCAFIREFTMDTGIINTFLGFFGVQPKTMLNYPEYFVPVYITSEIWQTVGWGSIIYLAALTSIDSQLYEASMLDGANRWKQTLHVTLPGILPTIVMMLILKAGSILNVGFEKIILLYNNSTMSVADVISTYTYRKGLLDLNWSYSSAVGLFNSIVNFVFVMGTNYISKKVNGYGLW